MLHYWTHQHFSKVYVWVKQSMYKSNAEKTLIIRLDEIGEPDIEGNRVLFFNLNGQRREITIKDNSIISTVQTRLKAEPTNREQIGATMSGSVLDVLVKKRR